MAECTGLYYSRDIIFEETSLFNADVFRSGVVLYEVIRIVNGTMLFFEDHIDRLQESVRLSGYAYSVSVPVVHFLLRNLIKRNQISNGNVKVVLHFQPETSPVIYTYVIPHEYPSPEMYANGVEADLFVASRANPNIKKLLPEVRQRVSEYIRSENLYDALLVAEDGSLTEGSKTNVFFVSDNCVYTTPGDCVLKGITRAKIIQICNELSVKLYEAPIYITKLGNFEASFFTGTSPKVLPIRRIANITYTVDHPVIQKLMVAYNNLIASYLSQ